MKYLLYLFKRVPVRLRIVYIVSLLLSNCPLVFDIITPVFFRQFFRFVNHKKHKLLFPFVFICINNIKYNSSCHRAVFI